MADMTDVKSKAKYDFLGTMYKAMWDNINRHVTALWQSTAVLATAFGAALLIGRSGGGTSSSAADATADFAASVVIAACAWLVCHAFDAAKWFNRNIQIIGNIEAVFFGFMEAEERVHPYSDPKWRRRNKVLAYMKLQAAFGVAIGVLAFAWHFYIRVWPTLSTANDFDLARALPSIVMITGAGICWWFWGHTRADFDEFLSDWEAYRAGAPSKD